MFSLRRHRQRPPRPLPRPTLTLGTLVGAPGSCQLGPAEVRTHVHLSGLSGFGKSSLELALMAELLAQHEAFSLIDPHADLADGLLALLAATGFFTCEEAYRRLWYVDWCHQPA